MEERADLLFRRWCVRGDVESLGELFDLVAPRLLGVAIHVVGDPSEAEDLVQATFLAAVQGRGEIDASRPALPWLMGVLAHKATDLRRRRGRSVPVDVDWQQVLGSESTDPTRRAETLELEGQVAKAIDTLGEPDRRVLLLRLRHGMAIADIAHLLDKSPGSVRVQLHRGFKKLRERLPVSYAGLGALAMALGGSRGLDVVRAEVVRAASVPVVLGTSTFWIGAWVMAQKHVWIGVAAVLVATLGMWSWLDPGTAPSAPDVAPAEVGGEVESVRVDPVPVEGIAPAVEEETRRVVEGPADLGFQIQGRVLDAESGEPLGGALVELHPPQVRTLDEALSAGPELFYVEPNGTPMPRTLGDWPRIDGLSGPGRFGEEPIRLYAWTDPETEPVAVALSGDDGSFSLSSGPNGGVLVVEQDGYGRRIRAAHDPQESWDVKLRPTRRFFGKVMVAGRAPDNPLRIVVSGRGEFVRPEGAEMPYEVQPEDTEGLGSWTTVTDASGSFDVEVAADEVTVGFLDPGWKSQGGMGLYSVGEEVLIFATRFPVLEFRDGESGAPVERVRLLGRELQNQYIRWSGEFTAPEGRLTLPGSGALLDWHKKDTLAFTVWAEGYADTSVTVTEIGSKDVIPVTLEPGEAPRLLGRVLNEGEPLVGAEVALLAQSRLSWHDDDDTLIDAIRCDADGQFVLRGPVGEAILRASGPGGFYFEVVELPRTGPLEIDFATTGSITGIVRGEDGAPRTGHVVALNSDDGRGMRTYSDEEGRLRFDRLSPGNWKVFAPFQTTESSFGADIMIEVDLARGENHEIEIEVPVIVEDRHAWIVAEGVLDYTGWRVRYGRDRYGRKRWSELEPDGRIPMDLTTEHFTMLVRSPMGQDWNMRIPKSAPDGYRIHLDLGAASYRGVVLDPSGEPLPGVRVFAKSLDPRARDHPVCSRVTDEAGLFELTGLAVGPHEFELHSDPEGTRAYSRDNKYRWARLRPGVEPGEGVWIEIRIPERPRDSRVVGHVLDASGKGRADLMVRFECVKDLDGGASWVLSADHGLVHTDGEGRFEILLPRCERRKVTVYDFDAQEFLLETEQVVGDADPEPELELRLPD